MPTAYQQVEYVMDIDNSFYVLSDNEIEKLINCEKRIVIPPKKKLSLDAGHWRNDMKLQSIDGQSDFLVFMRKNEDFEENFSIGLIFKPRDVRESVTLLRCNGPHGPHIMIDDVHLCCYHVHKAKSENMRLGLRPERDAFRTTKYASFQDALGFFLKTCKILDAEKHFPYSEQLNLF